MNLTSRLSDPLRHLLLPACLLTPLSMLSEVHAQRRADIVVIMDDSAPMVAEGNMIPKVVDAFGTNLVKSGIDFRIAIVGFGGGIRVSTGCANTPRKVQSTPVLVLPFTRNIKDFKDRFPSSNKYLCYNKGGRESGMEALLVTLNRARTGNLGLKFRTGLDGALKVFILITDEDNDRPVWPGNVLGSLQAEIDEAAKWVVAEDVLLNIVHVDNKNSRIHYGDARADSAYGAGNLPDYSKPWDRKLTLRNLRTRNGGQAKNSLQERILAKNGFCRNFKNTWMFRNTVNLSVLFDLKVREIRCPCPAKATVAELGPGTGNGLAPSITATRPEFGDYSSFQVVGNTSTVTHGCLMLGWERALLPPSRAYGGPLYVDLRASAAYPIALFPVVLDTRGRFNLRVPVPGYALDYCGKFVAAQALLFDSRVRTKWGVSFSRGLRLTVGNQ